MGRSIVDAMRRNWLSRGRLVAAAVGLAALLPCGCESDTNERVISSAEFRAPTIQSMRALSDKIDFLKAIFPNRLVSELDEQQSTPRPLGKVSEDELLIYERLSGALVTVNLCPACTDSQTLQSRALLHWSQDGLETDLFDTWGVVSLDPAISFDTPGDPTALGVTPLTLKGGQFRGLTLVYETSSGSILSFRRDLTFRPVPDALANPEASPNFGFGNGLFMSVVVSGTQMADQLDRASPRVSRMFELEEGKILVFFTTLPEVHLLELTLEPSPPVDFDLSSTADQPISVQVPVGRFRTQRSDGTPFESFLDFAFIQENVTQNQLIDIDNFQPIFVTPSDSDFCSDGALPKGGAALVFDTGSSNFIQIREDLDPASARFEQGTATRTVSSAELVSLLGSSPPYFMSEAIFGVDCSSIVIFEEISNNLFDFNANPDAAQKLKVAAESSSFLLRRDPTLVTGEDVVPAGEETVLRSSQNNILDNRLYFDQGRDQLIAVHYDSGNVVIVADRQDFEVVTERPLADFTWIEVLPPPAAEQEELRIFDTESTSLLAMRLRFVKLPVVDQRR